jgi:hypothetical protein
MIREGVRERILGRMARRMRGRIPPVGFDRAANAARRPKMLSPYGLRRFWRGPVPRLRDSLGRDRMGYRHCARALARAKIGCNATLP